MESTEHFYTCKDVTLTMANGTKAPANGTTVFTVGQGTNSPIELTYGWVVALSGDFYGSHDNNDAVPISTPRKNGDDLFRNGIESMAHANSSELKQILDVLHEEKAAVDHALANKTLPSRVFKTDGPRHNFRLSRITDWYLKLAASNMDHFGDDARTAYKIGHQHACTQAAAIKSAGVPTGETQAHWWDNRLKAVYWANACADHFLTDLFSAGHIATPRRALFNIGFTFPAETGLVAKAMHDEDSANGLHVYNAKRETWLAFGDGKELDSDPAGSSENIRRAGEAVQASADEIYDAFNTGKSVPANPALDLAPQPFWRGGSTPPMGAGNTGNYPPLFWAPDPAVSPSDKRVYRRGTNAHDYNNRTKWAFTSSWGLHDMASGYFVASLKSYGYAAMAYYVPELYWYAKQTGQPPPPPPV